MASSFEFWLDFPTTGNYKSSISESQNDRLADQCTQYLKCQKGAGNSDASHLHRLALKLLSDVHLKILNKNKTRIYMIKQNYMWKHEQYYYLLTSFHFFYRFKLHIQMS